MEHRRLYLSLAAAAIVVLAAFAIAGRWPGSSGPDAGPATPGAGAPAATSTVPGTLKMEVVTISSSTPLYRIHAEYPRFPDEPGFSSEIAAHVEEAVAQFEGNVRANDRAREDTGGTATEFVYSLGITWDPAQLNGRYVSFLVRLDAFEGGANLRQEARAFNRDVQADRAVTLGDLFPEEPAYLQRVSAYARQVLGDTLDPSLAEFVEDGTQPTVDNFSRFTFTEDAVTFVFPKYQVAPGAAGEQKIAMPRQMPGLF